jgi:hypothetical protein
MVTASSGMAWHLIFVDKRLFEHVQQSVHLVYTCFCNHPKFTNPTKSKLSILSHPKDKQKKKKGDRVIKQCHTGYKSGNATEIQASWKSPHSTIKAQLHLGSC